MAQKGGGGQKSLRGGDSTKSRTGNRSAKLESFVSGKSSGGQLNQVGFFSKFLFWKTKLSAELGKQLHDARYKLDMTHKKLADFEAWHKNAEAEKKMQKEIAKTNLDMEIESHTRLVTAVQAKLQEATNRK